MKLTREQASGLHAFTSHNKEILDRSGIYLCGYCKKGGLSKNIKNLIDDGETAICPDCGIDALIPAMIPHNVLGQLNESWFSVMELLNMKPAPLGTTITTE